MKKSILITLIMIAAVFSAAAQSNILIATPEWEGSTNKDGSGFYFDIMRAVFEPAGYKVTHRIVPWDRATMMVQKGQADLMLGTYYEAENLNKRHYPKWPFEIEETVAVFKKSRVSDWKGMESLHGQTAVWPRGYDYHEFMEGIVPVWSETDGTELGIKMLAGDRMLYYIDAANDVNVIFKKLGINKADYRIEVIMADDLYPGFSPSDKGRALAKIYDERIAALIKSGELQKIYAKYDVKYKTLKPRE